MESDNLNKNRESGVNENDEEMDPEESVATAQGTETAQDNDLSVKKEPVSEGYSQPESALKQSSDSSLLQEEMLAFYGEDENAYSSDLEKQTVTPPTVEEHESSVDEMSSEDTPQEPIVGNGMATCEFCGNVGERDSFFSRTKRFCKMECAKKYSASNIRKRMRGDSGSSYKKRQKTNARKIKVKVKMKEAPVVKEEENWQNKSFTWDDYLKQTGAVAAPSSLFKHVQITSCLKDLHIGMKVEVINNPCKSSDDVDVAFWVATVMQINQFKVLLQYEGYDDTSNADFWFDLRSKDIHPVGWCASQNKLLIPPLGIQNKMANWRDFLFKKLSGARTFSQAFLQRIQNEPCNKFEVGMKLEVADRKNLYSMCVATVVDIVGDRLRLRYDGLDLDVADDYWCHYLSSEIHPIGWSSLVGHTLQPPIGWKNSLTKWNEFLANDLSNSKDAPQSIFVQDSTGTAPGPEQFKVGMKLESFDPLNPSHIVVVTVIKVLKFNYFVLGIDSLATYFCCHANSRNIFPVGWSKRYGITLTPPRDYTPQNFEWSDYLSKTGAQVAPESLFKEDKRVNGFKVGMKLEAVDLREPALICPATIVETKGPLLRIHFDGWDTGYDQYLDMDSLDVFPVGWCESVGHPLQPPGALEDDPVAYPANLGQKALMLHYMGGLHKVMPSRRQTREAVVSAGKLPPKEQIHFNKKCNCGPFLDKDIVLKLPENIKGVLSGSEKESLMRKCLQEVIQAAYNPKQVMELFSREFYQTKKNRDLDLKSDVCIEIESKNSKRIVRRVRVASRTEHVKPYLERICQVLCCCPHFISQTRFLLGYCSKSCLEKALEDNQSGTLHKISEAGSSTDAIPGPTTSTLIDLTPDTETCLPTSSQEYKVDPMEDVVNSSVFTYDRTFNNGKDPRLWSNEEVCNFISLIGCASYSDNFMKEDVDGQALLLLNKDMLRTLTENRLGPIAKIENAIDDLKQQWDI